MSDDEITRTHLAMSYERLAGREYSLEVIEGPDKGRSLKTRARLIRIGTSPECDLELNDETVSRIHARIELDSLGHRIIDEDSKNGTYINNLRIKDLYLPSQIALRIGNDILLYQQGQEQVEIELSRSSEYYSMIGQSPAMREIFAVLERVAQSDMTILVEGETGTGKELVADALHQGSKRRGPLVVFDCSAVAPNLIESELFGHVKGAFTGAAQSRKGAFERAQGGTLFLDEIGELPLDLQPKLLRALEQREIRPVGGDHPIRVDARIVAATNRHLQQEVEDGHFRQDLYYRLAVLRIALPPLRRRSEDIPLLVNHFLKNIKGKAPQVGYETIVKLQHYAWPGNVRELRNFVERAAVLATEDRIETRFLVPPTFGETTTAPAASGAPIDVSLPFKDAKARLIENFEREYWTELLKQTDGNISAAARSAGIHRKSAEYLLKKLDIHF